MDFISHIIWTFLLYEFINRRYGKSYISWKAGFWGWFPDLFAFMPMILLILFSLMFGMLSLDELGPPEDGHMAQNQNFQFTRLLYSFSHSLIIFSIIFLTLKFFLKKTFWVMGGWLLHILVDIPTHSIEFYPTPFLWPISSFVIDGISWGTPTFILINYSLILIASIFIYKIKKQKKIAKK